MFFGRICTPHLINAMKIYASLVFAVLVCTAAAAEHLPSLTGMQGLHISCKSEAELSLIKSFDGVDGFDFTRFPRDLNDTLDVLVEAGSAAPFRMYLEANQVDYEVFTENFEEIVQREARQQRMRMMRRSVFAFDYFPTYEQINAFLENVVAEHREIAAPIVLGQSYEKREIRGVKISSGGEKKPVVFIDAGIHAREWIAPTTALYVIQQLVLSENKNLLDDVDFHIFPTINPDGYAFTHSTFRLWRKNRSPTTHAFCKGTDLNRNFGHRWMETGASNQPCSEIYAGERAFSEVESQNVRDYLLSLNDTVKVYLSFHSYGQYLLHPWGYTYDLPENEPLLRNVGSKVAAVIEKARGTKYQVGSSTRLLYAAAGGSDDWSMAEAGADLAYCMELPGQSFVIDPKFIVPVGQETFEGVKVFAQFAATRK